MPPVSPKVPPRVAQPPSGGSQEHGSGLAWFDVAQRASPPPEQRSQQCSPELSWHGAPVRPGPVVVTAPPTAQQGEEEESHGSATVTVRQARTSSLVATTGLARAQGGSGAVPVGNVPMRSAPRPFGGSAAVTSGGAAVAWPRNSRISHAGSAAIPSEAAGAAWHAARPSVVRSPEAVTGHATVPSPMMEIAHKIFTVEASTSSGSGSGSGGSIAEPSANAGKTSMQSFPSMPKFGCSTPHASPRLSPRPVDRARRLTECEVKPHRAGRSPTPAPLVFKMGTPECSPASGFREPRFFVAPVDQARGASPRRGAIAPSVRKQMAARLQVARLGGQTSDFSSWMPPGGSATIPVRHAGGVVATSAAVAAAQGGGVLVLTAAPKRPFSVAVKQPATSAKSVLPSAVVAAAAAVAAAAGSASLPQTSRGQGSEEPEALVPGVADAKMIRETLANERALQRYAGHVFGKFDANGDDLLDVEELGKALQYMSTTLGIGEFTSSDSEHYMRRFNCAKEQQMSLAAFEGLYRSLLHAKLHDHEPLPFNREMFIGRREGNPTEHYELLSVLGEGTFGSVHQVQCRQTGALRVLKTVDKHKAVNSGSPVDLVMEEVDKLRLLDHPAVLRLFEYFVDEDMINLVTDLLPGGDLLAVVEGAQELEKPLPEVWVSDVFRQTCEGVAYIHAKGIMHKDLKLENIMLCNVDPPEAVIIDVGLAELFPPNEAETFHSAQAAGTLATMAPEVIMGSFACKCDVWSLGCCLFALLCRRPWTILDTVQGAEGQQTVMARLYPYPFLPPEGGSKPSREQLEEHLARQRQGPNLTPLDGAASPGAEDIISVLLTYEEQARPSARQVLSHPWLRRGQSRGHVEGEEEQQANAAPVLATEQLESLLRFRRAGTLEQTVLLDVASKLSLGQLREIKPLFEALDKDGDGMLTSKELADGMCQAGLGQDVAENAAECICQHSGNSKVEFSRFVAALVPSCQDLLARHLRETFDRLDADSRGYIGKDELTKLLEQGPSGNPSTVAGSGADQTGKTGASVAAATPEISPAAKAAIEALEELGLRGSNRVSFRSLRRYLGAASGIMTTTASRPVVGQASAQPQPPNSGTTPPSFPDVPGPGVSASEP